jgi:hypothetical protein
MEDLRISSSSRMDGARTRVPKELQSTRSRCSRCQGIAECPIKSNSLKRANGTISEPLLTTRIKDFTTSRASSTYHPFHIMNNCRIFFFSAHHFHRRFKYQKRYTPRSTGWHRRVKHFSNGLRRVRAESHCLTLQPRCSFRLQSVRFALVLLYVLLVVYFLLFQA